VHRPGLWCEPLLRKDVVDIVRNIKNGASIPYTLFMSNWSLMTEEKYLELRDAGIDQFNVSLDMPDERHDDFRQLPGLYSRLEKLVPRLASLGHDDIVLNACITSVNVAEINRLADKAKEWGVNIVYSSYSARRTGCRDWSLTTPAQLETLKREFDQVETRRDETNYIVSSPATLVAMRGFFERGGTPGCKAGHRFLVVTSDGALQPCSMVFSTLFAGRTREDGRGIHQD
jgi:MoaA/NifB/PqqE/SkfB family radical SAM enzyme